MKLNKNMCMYLSLALFLGMMGCAGQLFRNYGQINPSAEVTRAFESHQVNKDFRYYVTGADLHPNALMGLHRDYQLDPRTLWKEVEMTQPKMKELVEQMKIKALNTSEFQMGFEMSDDKGRPIGIWYSLPRARTFLRIQEDGTTRIDTPDLDTYQKKGGAASMTIDAEL